MCLCKVDIFITLTFTIGWLKRRSLSTLKAVNTSLTFTIGWLKPSNDRLHFRSFPFNFHHRVVETFLNPSKVANFFSLTFTIGWLKRERCTNTAIYDFAFNFHHRVVETIFVCSIRCRRSSLTFTIGWLKQKYRIPTRIAVATLTFTIGWLKQMQRC